MQTNGGMARKGTQGERPTIVTVDKNGLERKWGPLSRTTAWRAGSYWEEMERDAKVFLEKDEKRTEVTVQKVAGKRGPRFWFKEKEPEPPTQHKGEGGNESITEDEVDESITEEEVDESVTEDLASGMSEDEQERGKQARECGLSRKSRSSRTKTRN